MNRKKQWTHKWFGIWKEYGEDYEDLASIQNFITKGNNNYDDDQLQKIIIYLTQSQIIPSTSRIAFPDPISGEEVDGSISYRTDGVWLWLDDLPDYIEKYNVKLPNAFLMNIKKNKYKPQDWSGDIEKLD